MPTTISTIAVFMPVFWVSAQDLPGNAQNGRRIYEQSCARCHGITGAGDGMDAARLVVGPAGLRSFGLLLKSDLELLRPHGKQSDGTLKLVQAPSTDTRIPLRLPTATREGMQQTMREHLEALQAIVAALAREDFEKAATVAHEDLGFPKHHQAMQREQGAPFPPKYQELAMAHHQAAEELAKIIPSKDMTQILPHLEKTMKACVACHQAYKL